jgi:hypothetical protein
VNLKEYVFSREFVELPDAEKRKRLAADVQHRSTKPQAHRARPPGAGSHPEGVAPGPRQEVKYLNSGNRKAYQEYREADQDGRRVFWPPERPVLRQAQTGENP